MENIKMGVASFLCGVIFAAGLGVSGMTEPAKIIGFLNLAGHWDPSLILVMVGAIGVNLVFYRFVKGKKKPALTEVFQIPTRKDIDPRLIGGAAVFGVGWGVTGLCPGPGIATLVSGNLYSVGFVVAMLVGMSLIKLKEAGRFVKQEAKK